MPTKTNFMAAESCHEDTRVHRTSPARAVNTYADAEGTALVLAGATKSLDQHRRAHTLLATPSGHAAVRGPLQGRHKATARAAVGGRGRRKAGKDMSSPCRF